MTIRQCMLDHTNREYLTWQAYLDEELNNPDRSDHYAMQIAMEIRRANVKNPQNINSFEPFKIPFELNPKPTDDEPKEVPKKRKQVSNETAARWAKQIWYQRLGLFSKIKPTIIGPDGNQVDNGK